MNYTKILQGDLVSLQAWEQDWLMEFNPSKYEAITFMTYHVTYHVWPHQPIIDQQGLGLRGLVHKEAHPVIPDLY